MNACLVLPKYNVSLDDPCCYPLGFMYVSSIMKEQGHTVKVLNFNLFEYDVKEELKNQDVILFTGHTEFLEDNEKIRSVSKSMGIRTIIGGYAATFSPEILVEYDVIISGEYEKCGIDQIPYPDYEGFGIEEYHKRHALPYMGVLTSRGCPFSCHFCAHTCRYRERDLEDVKREIALYGAKYGVEMVIFNDNTLNVSKNRFMSICDMMKDMNIVWSAAIRTDVFDEDMAIAAKDSGGSYFVVGVESFDQNRLDKMNKKTTVSDNIKTLDLLNKYKLEYHGNIIFGMDGDTVDTIAEEMETLPSEYNLFPVVAQHFAGTDFIPSLTKEQERFLNIRFEMFANKNGKSYYT